MVLFFKLFGIDCMTLDFGHNDLTKDLSLPCRHRQNRLLWANQHYPLAVGNQWRHVWFTNDSSFCCSFMRDGEGFTLGEMNVLLKIALMKLRRTVVEVQWGGE
jgi:hypothetical protein